MLDVVSPQVDGGLFGGEKMSIVALKRFVEQATKAVSEMTAEDMLLQELESAMADLVSNDDWLPEQFGRAHERYYRRYLLHCDPLERFSVVSLVWGAGQGMSVHNHTVWGVVGMLRGAEINTGFEQIAGGSLVALEERRLETGEVARHSPTHGDIHSARNALSDGVSIGVHVYGGNIGQLSRQVFDVETGRSMDFISSFASDVVPNIWRRDA